LHFQLIKCRFQNTCKYPLLSVHPCQISVLQALVLLKHYISSSSLSA
jgi:hypothetical protein